MRACVRVRACVRACACVRVCACDTLEVAIDFDRKIQGTHVHSFDPVTRTSNITAKVVLDSNKLMTYVVPTANPDLCIKSRMAYPMITGVRCIPGFSNMTVTIAFTVDDCKPLMDTGIYDPSTVPTENVFLWWDYESDFRDMSIFDLPPSCHDHPVGK
nr:hypothetical protein BaRGS_018039 [Batillaria attramentaria]